ncbi:MAG TPA: PadR family transcriptional regulator [Actinocrinis sp.]|nr:PadR family transcriptional regulator [Actinocrinis sp.]
MPEKRKVSNLLALAVLSYLTERPMHPYELGRTLREHGDERSIKFNHGSLYMVVGQLEKAGFIVAEGTDREGQRPERTVYALTDAGRAELGDWLRELVAEPQHEYPQFLSALSLIAALPPDQVLALLRRRLELLAPVREEISSLIAGTVAQGVPALFMLEEEYRLALLGAETSFVEQLVGRLTDLSTDWVRMWAAFHHAPLPADRESADDHDPEDTDTDTDTDT